MGNKELIVGQIYRLIATSHAGKNVERDLGNFLYLGKDKESILPNFIAQRNKDRIVSYHFNDHYDVNGDRIKALPIRRPLSRAEERYVDERLKRAGL